jgi:ABC-type transport system involved in Fe-S cluster assembly fused permease/ATPase subunit
VAVVSGTPRFLCHIYDLSNLFLGKSSVMSLIQHLYEQSSGKVMLDGIDVRELSPAWLSRNVSIVSQEPTLFARSIKKNIMYGLEETAAEPTEEEIIEAAKLANAHDFIMKMPQGYDTEVGERRYNTSIPPSSKSYIAFLTWSFSSFWIKGACN